MRGRERERETDGERERERERESRIGENVDCVREIQKSKPR